MLYEVITNRLALVHAELAAQQVHGLNAVGSLVNLGNPAVAQQLLLGIFPDKTVAAVNLNALAADLERPVSYNFV